MTAAVTAVAPHIVAAVRYPTFASGLPAWVRCSCGETVTEQADRHLADPWQPAVEAWRRHRKSVGLSTPTDGRGVGQTGDGWDGSWGCTAHGRPRHPRRSARERGLMGVAAKRAAASKAKAENR